MNNRILFQSTIAWQLCNSLEWNWKRLRWHVHFAFSPDTWWCRDYHKTRILHKYLHQLEHHFSVDCHYDVRDT